MGRTEFVSEIAEAAQIIAASVPLIDLQRLAWLLTHGGGCDDLVAALPVTPPHNLTFTGNPKIALNKAARILKQSLPNLDPLKQILEDHIRDGDGQCQQLLWPCI